VQPALSVLTSMRVPLQGELCAASPERADVGNFFQSGAVVRLQKRLRDPSCTRLNLSHSLWGEGQAAALQVGTRVSP
jgi:hypothetical protein